MNFHEYDLENSNFIKFGDLHLQTKIGKILLNGISMILDYNETHQIICFASIDGYTYVQNLTNPVPIMSLPIKLPYLIQILDSGDYIVILNFGIKEDKIKTTSKGSSSDIQTKFPRIYINIVEISSKKNFKKSLRFPTHLFDTNQSIVVNSINSIESRIIEIVIPSYIDNSSQLTINFDLTTKKFSRANMSKIKRYWKSKQVNNQRKIPKYGSEFIVEENPEIKRHLKIRPSFFEDRKLYRKLDKELLASAKTVDIVIPQLSTSTIYNRIAKTPFKIHLRGKERIIHIVNNHAKLLENEDFTLLQRSKKHPLVNSIPVDQLSKGKFDRVRIEQFLEQLINSNAVHKSNGIYFSSDGMNFFTTELKKLLESISN